MTASFNGCSQVDEIPAVHATVKVFWGRNLAPATRFEVTVQKHGLDYEKNNPMIEYNIKLESFLNFNARHMHIGDSRDVVLGMWKKKRSIIDLEN